MIRLSFGSVHLLQSWAIKLGLPSGMAPQAPLYALMADLSAVQLGLWTVSALGYLATAGLALCGHRRVVWVACASAVLDGLYWVSLSVLPQYQAGYSLQYSVGDAVINISAVLICLGSVMISRRAGRPPSANTAIRPGRIYKRSILVRRNV